MSRRKKVTLPELTAPAPIKRVMNTSRMPRRALQATNCVLSVLQSNPEGLSTARLAELTGYPAGSVGAMASKLAMYGKIAKVRDEVNTDRLRYVWKIKGESRMNKIITVNVYPPIPDRRFDWRAHHEGDEETNHCGWGPTEAEAIADLLRLDDERAETGEIP